CPRPRRDQGERQGAHPEARGDGKSDHGYQGEHHRGRGERERRGPDDDRRDRDACHSGLAHELPEPGDRAATPGYCALHRTRPQPGRCREYEPDAEHETPCSRDHARVPMSIAGSIAAPDAGPASRRIATGSRPARSNAPIRGGSSPVATSASPARVKRATDSTAPPTTRPVGATI